MESSKQNIEKRMKNSELQNKSANGNHFYNGGIIKIGSCMKSKTLSKFFQINFIRNLETNQRVQQMEGCAWKKKQLNFGKNSKLCILSWPPPITFLLAPW